MNKIDVSVIIPCLNEEEGIGSCIKKIQKVFEDKKIKGEIIVCDNGSTDNSEKIARSLGVKLLHELNRGYGNSYLKIIKSSGVIKGKYIIMGDADGSHDFSEIPKFLNALEEGNDFVIGSRFKGVIEKGSMRFLHKYFGNPILNFIFNFLFKTKFSDTHCGYRAIRKENLYKLDLNCEGMEFALEMLLKVVRAKMKIKEIPVNQYKEASKFKPLKESFKVGFRHLKFMFKNYKR